MSRRSAQIQVAGLFTVVSMLVGVLVVGAILPVLFGIGYAANTSVTGYKSIPSQLTKPPLPQQTVLLASDGTRLATLYYQDRIEVKLSEVAPIMQDAIVAIEDNRFYNHHGFDLRGTLRALMRTASGSSVQGGSTITQQYVKNILIASATDDNGAAEATARTPARKLRELRYSLAIEKVMTKKEILEGYLNIAYFGAGAYGVEAASRRYFSKPASALNLAEASLLAGLVQQPYGYDPLRHPEAAAKRRSIVLHRMAELGLITTKKADAVAAKPLTESLKPSTNPNGCTSSVAPFYCDYVLNVIRSSPAFGNTLAERMALLRQGGLTIVTSLDLKAQAAAQAAVNSHIPPKDKSGKAAAITMIKPGTGDVIAMAQNREWGTSGRGKTTYNYNVDRSMGGTIGMQAGSTFKVFVLAAALEQHIPPTTVIKSPATKTFSGFQNCTDGAVFPDYTAKNSTHSGTFDMREATAYSVNTYFVALERRTGLCRPADIAESMGVRTGAGAPLARVPSFVLGANEIAPIMMANAYATFAAHGLYCEPRVLLSAVDRNGNHLPVGGVSCNQVLDPDVADGVTSLLRGVIDGNIPGRTGGRMALGREAAGKTGTTNDSAAVWFSGYTPDLAASVWVGDPRGGFKYPMKDITINGKYFTQVFGSLLPGPIWKESMLGALKGSKKVPFVLKLGRWMVEQDCTATTPGDTTATPAACPSETATGAPPPDPTTSVTASPTSG